MRSVLPWLLLLAVASTASAQFNEQDINQNVEVRLLNGDILHGTLVAIDGQDAVIDHPLLGRMEIPMLLISLVPEEEQADEDAVEVESPWEGVFAVSANGTSGNTQNKNVRVSFDTYYKTDVDSFTLNAWYMWAEAEHDTSDQQGQVFGLYEWSIEDSVWQPFVDAGADYDKFKDYDVRVFGHVGAGYPFKDTENEDLIGRIGLGASRKIGAESRSDGHTEPEGLVGAAYTLIVDEDTRFDASAYLYPVLNDFGEYRSRVRAQYETDIIPDSTWNFLAGAQHDYDSLAADDDKNWDLNWWLGIGYKF